METKLRINLPTYLFFLHLAGVGGDSAAHAGRPGRVAQDASQLDVPGAHLLIGGHQSADARGRQTLPVGGQKLQRYHEEMLPESTCRLDTKAGDF